MSCNDGQVVDCGCGQVVRVSSRTKFDYDNLAPGQGGYEIVAKRIDVSKFTVADLMVRVHANGIDDASGGRFEVQVYSDGYTSDDPDVLDFMWPLQAIVIDKTRPAHYFEIGEITQALGSMLLVVVSANQDQAQILPLNAELSIDLVLKS